VKSLSETVITQLTKSCRDFIKFLVSRSYCNLYIL